VLGAWRDLVGDVPREATMTAWVEPDPDGRPVVCAGYVWVGDPAVGERLVPAMRALGPALASRIEPITYLELQTRDDDREHGEHAFRRYWKGHYLREFTDAAIEAFLSRGALRGQDLRDGSLPAASLQSYGGAIREVGVDDSAFDHRDVLVEFVASARWTDPTEDDARIAAARRYGVAMEPFSSGAYVNTLTDEGQAGVRRAYRADKLARLIALKDRYDPDNVFHLNHNIRPSGQTI
jgi:Berberine and berberine like